MIIAKTRELKDKLTSWLAFSKQSFFQVLLILYPFTQSCLFPHERYFLHLFFWNLLWFSKCAFTNSELSPWCSLQMYDLEKRVSLKNEGWLSIRITTFTVLALYPENLYLLVFLIQIPQLSWQIPKDFLVTFKYKVFWKIIVENVEKFSSKYLR